ncbi:MAG: leucyl aminopeptidase [Patescibacteria group bacterium]|jgi:leucyl aminopeptidase
MTNMNILGEKIDLFSAKADVLILSIFGGVAFNVEAAVAGLPELVRKGALRQMKTLDFQAKSNESIVIEFEQGHAHSLVLIGLGDAETATLETAREMIGTAVGIAHRLGAKSIAVELPVPPDGDIADIAEAIVVGAQLADYAFDAYKPKNGAKRLKEMTLCLKNGRDLIRVRKSVEHGNAVATGVNVARDLVNMPAHIMTPTALAETATLIVKEGGKNMTLKVLDREECELLGMGAYLAVAQGSDHPPKFLHLTYTPERATRKRLAVVGKGVTFDSGGLSLKPADSMVTMKCDMAGAAAVLGLFTVIGQLQPRIEIHGIIAAAENMPSGRAIRPGDIVKASNGKTIEILNTDAEGRLTLADALTYAVNLKPTAIVDLATLTGACVVALGEEIAGLMSNDEVLAESVLLAAGDAGEKVWHMPLEKRYASLIESDVADLRNIGTSRYGGTLTAGLFLQEFVENSPWAHLDIAGPAFFEKPGGSYLGKGGTGYGVRTLVELLEKI